MPRRSPHAAAILRCACEPLEPRRLLCGLSHEYLLAAPEFDWEIESREADRLASRGGPEATSIVWSNRGLASDGFHQAFGTSAGAGRVVVDAVLDYWERIITNWNRSDGTTTLQVNISITTENGFGASAAPAATAPADGKPRTGSISIQRGNNSADPNDSNGWFFDPTPFEHTEFEDQIINAYAAVDTGSEESPDFFSLVSAEMAHVLGLISDKNNSGGAYQGYLLEASGYATPTGLVDDAEGGGNGMFWAFDGPTIDHLMTSFNGGDPNGASWGNVIHTAGGAANINFASQNWRGSEDTGNARYAFNERTLPSYVTTMILKDAYGYTVNDPASVGTFHALLDSASGNLLIRGGGLPGSDDVITITGSGSEITVSVDVGNDVPGTGAFAGAGNLPAYVTTFNAADVSSITIEAGDGNDTITINGIQSGKPITINGSVGNDTITINAIASSSPVTINAGFGTDTINIAQSGGNLDAIDSTISVNGEGGSDALVIFDTSNSFSDTFTIVNNTIGRSAFPTLSYMNLESLRIDAGSGNGIFNFQSVLPSTPITINAGAGNDTFNVGDGGTVNALAGALTLNGQAGSDTLNYNDISNSFAGTYTINSSSVAKTGVSPLSYGTVEQINLNAGTVADTIVVESLPSGTNATVNGNGGNDVLHLGGTAQNIAVILGTVNMNGGTGSDTLNINDLSSPGNLTYTLTQNSLTRGGFAGMTFDTVESINLAGSGGNNTYNIDPTPVSLTAAVTVNAGSGADSFRITPTAQNAAFIGGTLNLNGGGGADSFTLFDGSSTAAMPYTISTSSIVRGVQTMNHSSIETMTIHGTSGVNDFVVSSNSANLTMNGNNGNDRLFMGGAGQNLNGITGNVTFNGGAGTDSIELFDQQNPSNDSYSITQTSFDRDNFALLAYDQVESLLLEGGSGNNAFNIASTLSSMPMTLRGNDGNDNFVPGNLNTLDPIAGAITIDGGSGADNLSVIDIDYTGAGGFGVSTSVIARSGFGGITYSTLELITLNAGVISGTGNKTHQIQSLGSATTLTLNAGNGSDTILITPGSQNLNSIDSNITINGQGGTDSLVINDGNNPSDEVYTFVSNSVQRTGGITITFGTFVESLTFNSGAGNSTFNVRSVGANTPLTLNMGGGDDVANIGTGINILNAFSGAITIDGGAGGDSIILNDQGAAFATDYTITSTTFARSATGFAGLTFSAIEAMTLNGAQTSNAINVQSLLATTSLALNGNGGNDDFNLGLLDNVDAIDGPVTIAGGSGSDTVNVNDTGNTSAAGFTVTSTTLTRSGMGIVSYGTVEQITINSGGGSTKVHTYNGTSAGIPVRHNPGPNRDIFQITETSPTGPITIAASTGGDSVELNSDNSGEAHVIFDESITLGGLSIGTGGNAKVVPNGALVLRPFGISLTSGARLDLTDNTMIVDYAASSPLTAVRNALTSGYNNGAWNGTGIFSSVAAATPNHALGYAEASAIFSSFPAIFAGQSVDNTTVLVGYTRYGDANLDRRVNLIDFNRIAANFGSGSLWSDGNFNFDNNVNLADFNLLAANFGQTASPNMRETSPVSPVRQSIFNGSDDELV